MSIFFMTIVSCDEGKNIVGPTVTESTEPTNSEVKKPVNEFPPVYEKIDPYLATPIPEHLFEIPVVIMRFLPTTDGINLDISKAPDFWELGEISSQWVDTGFSVLTIISNF